MSIGPALPARIAAGGGSFAGPRDGKDDGRATVDSRPAKAQAASDRAWFTPHGHRVRRGHQRGRGSDLSPGGLHHLPAVDRDHRSRSRGDMSQTVGGQPGAGQRPQKSTTNPRQRCPGRREESTAPAETVTTVAAQPVSPPGGCRPEIRVHDGLHRFPSPTLRNRGRGHQRKTAFRGSGRPHRPALMLLALDSFSRHSCSVAGDSCDRLTWCRTGFPGCCRRSPAAGCTWRPVPHVPGRRS